MTIYQQIASNKRKTYLFIALFIGLITLVAYVFGKASGYGLSFAGIALIISGLASWVSYYYSDSIVLAISQARPADPKKDFDFFTVTENLCIAAGISKPKLYIIEDTALNAFATGRDTKHAVICATSGLLEKLERTELEGVISHELSHIRNYDIQLMSIVAVLVGTIAVVSDLFLRSLWYRGRRSDRGRNQAIFLIIGIILALLLPVVATLIQLAIARRREFLADASGALLTRYPEGLARALEKISKDSEVLEAATNGTAHLYIINPFKGKDFSAWFSSIFDTHPPVEKRIKLLREM